jgi:SEC-C motif-containing protein
MENIAAPTVIQRADGVTVAERKLKLLCDRSFLSLWSYSGIYRDQGDTLRGGDGKEVCDLLVVFEDHIIIFSDKDCVFPNSGDTKRDWVRWFKRAVLKSAEQVWGAERWIKSHPDRLFLDRNCKQPFPIDLPDPKSARVHRIVVAHDKSWRCRQELGGSGSLVVFPSIVGAAHYTDPVIPFTIGQINPAKGYVHVFDDVSLNAVMMSLDTVSDFVAYLTKKEQFITAGKLAIAFGEEDLLAYYLQNYNDHDEHDFLVPSGSEAVAVQEGMWQNFATHPQRLAQLRANEISYSWDGLIETFNKHLFAGTQYRATHAGFRDQERLLRFLAREPRTIRRILSYALLEFIAKSPPDLRSTRVIPPRSPNGTHYVFLALPQPHEIDYDQYRTVRMNFLESLCMVTKLRYPDAQDIVGIATEAGEPQDGRSEDALYYDARQWDEHEREEAERLQKELGLLTKLTMFARSAKEYPDVTTASPVGVKRLNVAEIGYPRKKPCPCGSGKRFKRCCGDLRKRVGSSERVKHTKGIRETAMDSGNDEFQNDDIYVQPSPFWKSEEWYGNVFAAVPTEEGPYWEFCLVFRTKNYGKRVFDAISAWNQNLSEDRKNNICISFIIESDNEYSTFIYPGLPDATENQVTDTAVLVKEFPSDEHFKRFQSAYRGKPFLFAAYYLKDGEIFPLIGIKPIWKFHVKIKRREELSASDLEFQSNRF